MNFITFSSGDRLNIIERRDCLFDPYADKRSSYLGKDEKDEPAFNAREERVTGFKFSEIRL